MQVDGYVRVSTQEQAREGYSIGEQIERLRAYCTARGWVLRRIWEDPGYSGAKMERPGLQGLLAAVKEGHTDLVLVYKLDRLSRSQKDTLYLIEDIFLQSGVGFVSINENFDTSTAFGRAMVGILSVFAQLEREQIRERTQMGRLGRAKDGLWRGGGSAPIGYDYIPHAHMLQPNPYEALQVREAFRLFTQEGRSIGETRRILAAHGYTTRYGAWRHDSTVRNILQNPVYTGAIRWKGELFQGKHEALIGVETFQRAGQRLDAAKGAPLTPFHSTQLLTGLLFCARCGARYFGSGAYRGPHHLPNAEKEYIHIYVCYSRAKTNKQMIRDPACKNKRWRAEALHARILEAIAALRVDPAHLQRLAVTPRSGGNDEAILAARITVLGQQMERLLDLGQTQCAARDAVAARIDVLARERSALARRLVQHAGEPLRAFALGLGELLGQCTEEQRQHIIRLLIRRVEIDGEDLKIIWNFDPA